jgi:hypothetical protein
MTAVRLCFAALLAAISLQCAAAPFAVQVGEARIGLDAPSGFADTTFAASPRLQELGEALTSASNRILLFALSDADLRRFTLGDPLELRRYMIVVTARGMERERLSESAFREFAGESVRSLGPLPAVTDYVEHLDSRASGATSLLAELRKDADAVSVLQGMRAKGSGMFSRAQYFLSTTSLLLVRGKALSLSVHTRYDEPADLEWIRLTTTRWIEELKRMNAR